MWYFFLFAALFYVQTCHTYNTTLAAKKAVCLQQIDYSSNSCIPNILCETLKVTQGWTVCLDDLLKQPSHNCLVYSFGIADQWGFEAAMGVLGCEVHAFDPTTNLPAMLAPNVTFHHFGLYGGPRDKSEAVKFSSKAYGKITGTMYHLKDIMLLLGHQYRNISVMKLDCEGCEWEVFGYMYTNHFHHHHSNTKQQLLERQYQEYHVMDGVQQLLVELHFSIDFVNSSERVRLMGRTFDVLFSPQFTTLRPFARFYGNNGLTSKRWRFVPELANAGFPTTSLQSCCREMGLLRRSNGYKITAEEVIRIRHIHNNTIIRGRNDKKVYLFHDGQKHVFKTMTAFTSKGYSFDNITVLPAEGDINYIPEGPSVV